jgi:hypothetical protein
VDCHNPHQVVRENRLRGIKGITFDAQVIETSTGDLNRPYVYEVCFRCHGNSYTNIFNGDRYPDDTQYRSNPLAVVSNVKFSMAGFSNKRLEFATYGNASQERTGGPDASYVDLTDPPIWGTDSLTGLPRRVGPGIHKAFHPVVAGGRNGTPALTKQLQAWSGGRAANEITIQCTDCHNNDYYNAYGTSGSPTPVQPRFLGPITESNTVRSGDVKNLGIAQDYAGERSQHPIGPHGSNYIRILRAPYDTDIANSSRNYRGDGFNPTHWDNFLLCFQCHDRNAFDPFLNAAGVQDPSWTNFFGVPLSPPDGSVGVGNPQLTWESNLHMYHMMRTGALCHECHYNVHSNAQAQNTIFGDGTGCIGGTPNCPAGLPPDDEDGISDGISDTHLINFAPAGPALYSGARRCDTSSGIPGEDVDCVDNDNADPNPNTTGTLLATDPKSNVFAATGVEGVTADRPVWYYTETDFNNDATTDRYGVFRCNLRCHGVVMSTCFYMGNANRNLDKNMNVGVPNGTWCAGGQTQIAPITTGSAAPPEIQKLLADFGRDLTSGSLAEATKNAVRVATETAQRSAK